MTRFCCCCCRRRRHLTVRERPGDQRLITLDRNGQPISDDPELGRIDEANGDEDWYEARETDSSDDLHRNMSLPVFAYMRVVQRVQAMWTMMFCLIMGTRQTPQVNDDSQRTNNNSNIPLLSESELNNIPPTDDEKSPTIQGSNSHNTRAGPWRSGGLGARGNLREGVTESTPSTKKNRKIKRADAPPEDPTAGLTPELAKHVDAGIAALSQVNLEDGSWVKIKDDPLDIYQKEEGLHVAGTAICQYTPKEVLELLLIPHTDPLYPVFNTDVDVTNSQLKQRASHNTVIRNIIFRKRQGQSKRDTVLISHYRKFEKGYYYSLTTDETEPKADGYTRVHYEAPNGWILHDIGTPSQPQTKIIYVGYLRMGGNLANFLANMYNRDIPIKVHALILVMNTLPSSHRWNRHRRRSSLHSNSITNTSGSNENEKSVAETTAGSSGTTAEASRRPKRISQLTDQEKEELVREECKKDIKALLAEDTSRNESNWKQIAEKPIFMYVDESLAEKNVQKTIGTWKTKYSPKQVLDALKVDSDHPISKARLPTVDKLTEIVRYGEKEDIDCGVGYIVYQKVAFVSTRDMCVRVATTSIENGYAYSTVSVDDFMPVPKGFVRVNADPGTGWIVRRVGDETEVTTISSVNLGGKLPSFITSFLLTDTPLQVNRILKAMEKEGIVPELQNMRTDV